MRTTLYEYCVQTGSRTLLDQWDAEKNAPLTPEDYGGLTALYSEWNAYEPFMEGVESEEEYKAATLSQLLPDYFKL